MSSNNQTQLAQQITTQIEDYLYREGDRHTPKGITAIILRALGEQSGYAWGVEASATVNCPFCARPKSFAPAKMIDGYERLWHYELNEPIAIPFQCLSTDIRALLLTKQKDCPND